MFFRPWVCEEYCDPNTEEDYQNPGPSSPRTPTKKKEIVIGRGAKLRKQTIKVVRNVKNFLRDVVKNGSVLCNK